MKRRGDTQTLDLLSWELPQVAAEFADADYGRAPLAQQISQAIGLALGKSSKTRDQIAKEMSEFLGEPISRGMLDAYASPGKEKHRITLERFMALIHAAGCPQLLGFVARQFDLAVVSADYVEVIELQLIDEHQREIDELRAVRLRSRRRAGR